MIRLVIKKKTTAKRKTIKKKPIKYKPMIIITTSTNEQFLYTLESGWMSEKAFKEFDEILGENVQIQFSWEKK